MPDEPVMDCGRHKGKPMSDLPQEYLAWMYANTYQAGYSWQLVRDEFEKREKERCSPTAEELKAFWEHVTISESWENESGPE